MIGALWGGWRPAPLLTILVAALGGALIAAMAIVLAVSQPWLGLELSGSGSEAGIRVAAVADAGPAAAIPPDSVLIRIESGDASVTLQPFDLAEDPDTADTYEAMNAFFLRQRDIAAILRHEQAVLTLASGSRVAVTPSATRPLYSLPFVFWMQTFVGVGALVIGAWALAFRFHNNGVRWLAAGGVALLISSCTSAVFNTRELAIEDSVFRALSALNFAGSFGFCVALLGLFLVYPRRLVSRPWVNLLWVSYLAWVVIEGFHIGVSGPALGRYVPITVTVVGALLAAALQYHKASGEPRMRAALGWFGSSIAVGTGIFILLFAVPSFLGLPPDVPQATAYALGLLVYAGAALGIIRNRLFEMQEWSFPILFYVVGAVAFAIVDVILVTTIALDHLPAFGLSLAVVALFYLPLRDVLARRLMPAEGRRSMLFADVVEVALSLPGSEREARWTDVLRKAFNPLSTAPAGHRDAPMIEDDGLALVVPGIAGIPPARLEYAHGGRRLFSRSDLDLATELCAMLVHSSESRDAYERGIAQERARIARDMHDNIGAKLLSALHGTASERKDTMIREALADLRGIVNNASGVAQTLDESLGELRLETAERLSAADIALDWSVDGEGSAPLSPIIAQAMRSIIREGVSNVLRHANANAVTITVANTGDRIHLAIADDGNGLDGTADPSAGFGLSGIRARLEGLRGKLEVIDSDHGLHLLAELPLMGGAVR